MSDSAKGPLAGYLFQFEKALLLLASLDTTTDIVSIEKIDDIAIQDENDVVITSIQSKHSIASSGNTFGDTSYALWRTIQIWITKLERNIVNDKTVFVCSTNKKIPSDSLLYKLANLDSVKAIEEIENLKLIQDEKLAEVEEKGESSGVTIKSVLKLIDFAISKRAIVQIILSNLKIEDEESVKAKFLNKLHLGSARMSEVQKDNIYHTFYGWMLSSSLAKWRNDAEANFTKEMFDEKFHQIISNSTILYAVFRTKESIGNIILNSDIQQRRQELFVQQIEDIDMRKEAKERIIKEAIVDLIYSDIEIKYIVDKGNFTGYDLDCFLEQCYTVWQNLFDQHFTKELDEYSDSEKNDIAIKLYHYIMGNVNLDFKDGIKFTASNQYVRNGSFLKLSNIPKIGWHPDWSKKYFRNEKKPV